MKAERGRKGKREEGCMKNVMKEMGKKTTEKEVMVREGKGKAKKDMKWMRGGEIPRKYYRG